MPLPKARPKKQHKLLNGYEYILTPNYFIFIYADNDLFTMGGKIDIFTKERILDTVNRWFYDLRQNIPDPGFTEKYRVALQMAEPQFYAMLARDMDLPTAESLHGWLSADSVKMRELIEKNATTQTHKADSAGRSWDDARQNTVFGASHAHTVSTQDASNESVTNQNQTAQTRDGATRIIQSGTTGAQGHTVTIGSSAGDNATVNIGAGRDGGMADSEQIGASAAGQIASTFPGVLSPGGGTVGGGTLDNWLTGSGAGNLGLFADTGSKGANTSSSNGDTSSVADAVSVGANAASTQSTNSAEQKLLSSNAVNSTTTGDAVLSSAQTRNVVQSGVNANAQNDGDVVTDEQKNVALNARQGGTQTKSDEKTKNDSKIELGEKIKEGGAKQSQTYADSEIRLNEAFAKRQGALQWLIEQLTPFWTLDFGAFPFVTQEVDCDHYPFY